MDGDEGDRGGAERRQHQRDKVLLSGRIQEAGRSQHCQIVDLSATGACVRLVERPPEFAQVRLILRDGSSFACAVAWQNDKTLGLCFVDVSPRHAEVHVETVTSLGC